MAVADLKLKLWYLYNLLSTIKIKKGILMKKKPSASLSEILQYGLYTFFHKIKIILVIT